MSNNNLYLKVPSSDLPLVTMLAEKMGWNIETNLPLMDKFIKSRPDSGDITEEEIMDEVRAVRYQKK